jgi:hypothetical protein
MIKVFNMFKSTKVLQISLVAFAVLFFAALAILIINRDSLNFISVQAAADKAIAYVDNNISQGGGTQTATLKSVTKEKGVYKVSFNIGTQEYNVYISKDGKYLFPAGYEMTPVANQSQGEETQTKSTCETLTKTADPTLEAFVVSNCPYGLQMQRVLDEVIKNIPSLAKNIRVEYIGSITDKKITSMHGDAEAQENLRQICIREEQSSKFWNYLSCYMKAGDFASCLTSTGVNTNQLSSCMTDPSKGLDYAQNDFDKAQQYGVSGSPTLFVNGKQVSEFDFGGRTAQALKTIICCGNNQQPGVCTQELSTTSAAASFSTTYEGSGSSNNANCN